MRRLILLSMQRSGTNWFMEIAGHLNGVLCLREVFNPRGVFGIAARGGIVRQALARHLGKAELDERDADLIALARSQPEMVLEIAEQAAAAAGYSWIGFTLFNNQVSDTTLQNLLAHPGTCPVLLKRRHLPRYISLIKARTLKVWKNVDTTGTRPPIDPQAFWREVEQADRWFGTLERLIESTGTQAPVQLTYEEHVLGAAERCLSTLSDALSDFPWRPGAPHPNASIIRQDHCDDVFARIGNGGSLQSEFRESNLLERALSYPGGA